MTEAVAVPAILTKGIEMTVQISSYGYICEMESVRCCNRQTE